MLRMHILKRFVFPLYRQQGEERLFTIHQNVIPSTTQQNIYLFPPLDAILVCKIPGEKKCIKPLTVFTCVGLMLMCEGKPEDGGWEIDHQ